MKRGSKTWKILRNLLFNVFSVRLAAITEIGQTERETYCIISFICGILKKKAHRKRDHIGGCQGQGCVEVREASESGQKV